MIVPRRSPARTRITSLFGLVLSLGLAAAPLGAWLAPGESLQARLTRESIWWALGAAVLAWVVWIEGRPMASIGLRAPTWRSLAWGLGATVLMMSTVMLSYAVIFPALNLKLNMGAVANITHTPFWLQTATMVRAGVIEEIIFRGYAIERLQSLTGSRAVAGIVSALVFMAVHIGSWGYAQLIVVGFGAAILTALYLLRRDLSSNMLAHFLTDFVGFALARLQGA